LISTQHSSPNPQLGDKLAMVFSNDLGGPYFTRCFAVRPQPAATRTKKPVSVSMGRRFDLGRFFCLVDFFF
jgi:hypothetical protein